MLGLLRGYPPQVDKWGFSGFGTVPTAFGDFTAREMGVGTARRAPGLAVMLLGGLTSLVVWFVIDGHRPSPAPGRASARDPEIRIKRCSPMRKP